MLNSGQNQWFNVPCDLEIWQMTLEKNRAPLLCCFKLCTSFHSHQWIQLKLQSRNAQFRSKSVIFFPCDLEIWWMILKNNRTPLLCYIKLCATFQSHRWIQTGVTLRKSSIRVKISVFVLCDLEIWWMTLENNRAPLLCCLKLLASFHSHWLIQSKVTVRKPLIRVKISDLLSSVTLKYHR